MPRLVRRQPLLERIKSYLDPYDFLIWLSEQLDSSALEEVEKDWTIPIGVILNLVFLIARANSRGISKAYDDVFADDEGASTFLSWLVSF